MRDFTYLVFIAIFALLQFSASAQAELQVFVSQIPSSNGVIKLAVYDSDRTFLSEEYFLTAESPVNGKQEVKITLSKLPFGTYAISVYHDENGNGQLDKKIFGIPKEAYGFSNNARKKFSPPEFKDAMFLLSSEKQFLQIDLR